MSWTWTAGAAVSHVKVCMALFVPQSPDHNFINWYFCFGSTYTTLRPFCVVFIEVKLQGVEETNGISWRIMNTDCKSDTNLQVAAYRVYSKDCELSLGQSYTLQCDNEGNTGPPSYNGWWKANFLVVENSVYCEYSDGMKMINITINGNTYTLLTNSNIIQSYNLSLNLNSFCPILIVHNR